MVTKMLKYIQKAILVFLLFNSLKSITTLILSNIFSLFFFIYLYFGQSPPFDQNMVPIDRINIPSDRKIWYQSIDLDETIPNMCFILFYKNQKIIHFWWKYAFLGF